MVTNICFFRIFRIIYCYNVGNIDPVRIFFYFIWTILYQYLKKAGSECNLKPSVCVFYQVSNYGNEQIRTNLHLTVVWESIRHAHWLQTTFTAGCFKELISCFRYNRQNSYRINSFDIATMNHQKTEIALLLSSNAKHKQKERKSEGQTSRQRQSIRMSRLLDWVLPSIIAMSWVMIWPHCIATRLHFLSAIGTSGKIVKLTSRARGKSLPLRATGGAWTSASKRFRFVSCGTYYSFHFQQAWKAGLSFAVLRRPFRMNS